MKDMITQGDHDDGRAMALLNLIGADVSVITYDRNAPGGGRIVFGDGLILPLAQIDRLVSCFTPGVMLATPKGEVAVQDLAVGDRLVTRDNGLRQVVWIGTKRLELQDLKAAPQLRPIRIRKGALGHGMPERDMLVSPSHRMLIVSDKARAHFKHSEILVSARDMLRMEGVEQSDQPYVTYVHVMCDRHEIILADGAWSESFQPGDFSLKGFDQAQRSELFAIFPELDTPTGIAAYGAARQTIGKAEAKEFFIQD